MKLVMVVDDSPTVRKILQVELERADYRVVMCSNGREAFQYCSRPEAAIPGLIFLDVRMPGVDGFEVAQRLKRNHRLVNSTIILLTRCDSVIDRLKARLAGAQAVITKPFREVEILAAVRQYLGDGEPSLSAYSSSLVTSRF